MASEVLAAREASVAAQEVADGDVYRDRDAARRYGGVRDHRLLFRGLTCSPPVVLPNLPEVATFSTMSTCIITIAQLRHWRALTYGGPSESKHPGICAPSLSCLSRQGCAVANFPRSGGAMSISATGMCKS